MSNYLNTRRAIREAISTGGGTVEVPCIWWSPAWDTALEAIHELWIGEVDYCITNEGDIDRGVTQTIEVWGWDDTTPTDREDWRLRLLFIED